MPLKTDVQFSIILYAMLAGILTGAMFDLYRIIYFSQFPKNHFCIILKNGKVYERPRKAEYMGKEALRWLYRSGTF